MRRAIELFEFVMGPPGGYVSKHFEVNTTKRLNIFLVKTPGIRRARSYLLARDDYGCTGYSKIMGFQLEKCHVKEVLYFDCPKEPGCIFSKSFVAHPILIGYFLVLRYSSYRRPFGFMISDDDGNILLKSKASDAGPVDIYISDAISRIFPGLSSSPLTKLFSFISFTNKKVGSGYTTYYAKRFHITSDQAKYSYVLWGVFNGNANIYLNGQKIGSIRGYGMIPFMLQFREGDYVISVELKNTSANPDFTGFGMAIGKDFWYTEHGYPVYIETKHNILTTDGSWYSSDKPIDWKDLVRDLLVYPQTQQETKHIVRTTVTPNVQYSQSQIQQKIQLGVNIEPVSAKTGQQPQLKTYSESISTIIEGGVGSRIKKWWPALLATSLFVYMNKKRSKI